jgi:hypothetical protein
VSAHGAIRALTAIAERSRRLEASLVGLALMVTPDAHKLTVGQLVALGEQLAVELALDPALRGRVGASLVGSDGERPTIRP